MKRRRPTVPRVVRDLASAQISDEELQRRIAAFRARVGLRIAGPDDPIYRDGLRMTAVRSVERRSQLRAEKVPLADPLD